MHTFNDNMIYIIVLINEILKKINKYYKILFLGLSIILEGIFRMEEMIQI